MDPRSSARRESELVRKPPLLLTGVPVRPKEGTHDESVASPFDHEAEPLHVTPGLPDNRGELAIPGERLLIPGRQESRAMEVGGEPLPKLARNVIEMLGWLVNL
jgi:hypothetical protein